MHRSRVPWLVGALAFALGWVAPAPAGPAHAAGFHLERHRYGTWSAILEVDHEDQGWSHFADRWEVLDQAGRRILSGSLDGPKRRDVEEDGPVRRRLDAFGLPAGTTRLTCRIHCKQSGWLGKALAVDLASAQGPGFSVRAAPPGRLPDFENVPVAMRGWRTRKHALLPRRYGATVRGPIPVLPPDPVDARPSKPSPPVPHPRGETAP